MGDRAIEGLSFPGKTVEWGLLCSAVVGLALCYTHRGEVYDRRGDGGARGKKGRERDCFPPILN